MEILKSPQHKNNKKFKYLQENILNELEIYEENQAAVDYLNFNKSPIFFSFQKMMRKML